MIHGVERGFAVFTGVSGLVIPTDEEMEDAVRWARQARINNVLVNLIVEGKVVMRLEPSGGFRFFASDPGAESAEPHSS